MEVRVWGARGSYPATAARFSEFGHHTACVTVREGDDLIVLDVGSGAAALGAYLGQNPVRRIHILLSHFHHDHILGLPFLVGGAEENTSIAVHAAFGIGHPLREIVLRLFSAPYFPCAAEGLFARIAFTSHPVGGTFTAGGFAIRTAPLEHPGGASAFRLERGGRSVVYASDVEDAPRPAAAMVALAQGADLLIHDTMFTAEEILSRRGWGHATIEAAMALASAAGARQLAGFHHNPAHDDAKLGAREAELTSRFPGACMLREGQMICL